MGAATATGVVGAGAVETVARAAVAMGAETTAAAGLGGGTAAPKKKRYKKKKPLHNTKTPGHQRGRN